MGSSWPENLPSDRRKAVDELVIGRDCANQLKIVLNRSQRDDWLVSAEDLVRQILNSFTNTLSILNSTVESDEVSQFPANAQVGSPCWDGRKSEDSGESSKSSTLKDRRGCYKRRKTAHSWTRDTPTQFDDGHAWRKYGQKVILNAKYPRNYFRCTHKYDQGCQATKQVQRIEEEPSVYRTTYYGQHTCKNFLKASQLLLESSTDYDHNRTDSSVLLSFSTNANNLTNIQDDHSFFTSLQPIKQEFSNNNDDNHMPSDLTTHINQSLSSDYLLSPDHLSTFDHTDVISGVNSSCTTSTHSLDMDMIVGSVDFDADVLGLEF